MAGEQTEIHDPELVAIAAAADAQLCAQAMPVPGAEPVAAEPVQDQSSQIGGLLTMGVMMAAPMLPFLPNCYTPEVINNISVAAAAVCEKHGWNVGDVMSPELVLAVAVLPPSINAFVMFKQWQALKRKEAESRDGHNNQADTVTPGLRLLPAPTQGG